MRSLRVLIALPAPVHVLSIALAALTALSLRIAEAAGRSKPAAGLKSRGTTGSPLTELTFRPARGSKTLMSTLIGMHGSTAESAVLSTGSKSPPTTARTTAESRRSSGTSKAAGSFCKCLVRNSFKASRNVWESLGNNIVVRALGKLRRYTYSSIAVIEISCTFNVLVVLSECPIITSAGTAFAVSGAQLVARSKLCQPRFGIFCILVPKRPIYGKAIGGIAKQNRTVELAQFLHEPGGNAVVVIRSIGLYVGVVLIEPQARTQIHCLILPSGRRISVVKLIGSGVKWNSVYSNAKSPHTQWRCACCKLRLAWHAEVVYLFGNRIWIARVGKCTGGVIWHSVRSNVAISAIHKYAHLGGCSVCWCHR